MKMSEIYEDAYLYNLENWIKVDDLALQYEKATGHKSERLEAARNTWFDCMNECYSRMEAAEADEARSN